MHWNGNVYNCAFTTVWAKQLRLIMNQQWEMSPGFWLLSAGSRRRAR
jgi:hypothetical protein